MANELMEGYDAPRTSRVDDDLERWRFASDIVRVIVNTPADWSVRVGIFGEWGEGKSTALRFAEQMLKEDGHLVFWFNPWAAQSLDDLWADFADRMHDALKTAGIKVENPVQEKARWFMSLLRKYKEPAEAVAGTIPIGKAAYSVGIRLMRGWLDPRGRQLLLIRKHLGSKRLIVLVDDLDRADPKLVPQLLLSMRELMDLPGFTFVLAFDDKVVGAALKEYHPAWDESGGNFLDKILDFRFHLPRPTPDQIVQLLRGASKRFCSFVPDDSIAQVEDLLPANPRKLKALVRNMSILQPEIERHDADELNWVDIWLMQLIQIESQSFFEELLAPDVIEREGPSYHLLQSLNERFHTGAEDQGANSSINERLDRCGVKDAAIRERLSVLMTALRNRASVEIRYNAQLTLKPNRITRKEFRGVLAQWQEGKRADTVSSWISEQASRRNAVTRDVQQELFDAAVNARERYIRQASETITAEENKGAVRKSLDVLAFIRCLTIELKLQTIERFTKIFGQAIDWIAFRTNPADQEARELERGLIFDLLDAANKGYESVAYLECLRPWDAGWQYGGIDRGALELTEAFRQECVQRVIHQACESALQLFKVPDRIRQLRERGRHVPYKHCLFSQQSPLWCSEQKKELLAIIGKGRQDEVVFTNCRDFFELIMDAKKSSIDYVSPDGAEVILRDEAFIGELWKTVTSHPIQYRMRWHYVEARRLLLLLGVPTETVPTTPELAEREAAGATPGVAAERPPG